MWEGWPLVRLLAPAPTLRIPDGFDLHLLRHAFDDATSVGRVTRGDETLWWPDDRSWVYARPVDSEGLYIACAYTMAEALLDSGLRGARLVHPSDPVIPDG